MLLSKPSCPPRHAPGKRTQPDSRIPQALPGWKESGKGPWTCRASWKPGRASLAPRTPITAGVWKAGSSVLGNRVSEEETCTRPRCSSFPPSRVNVQTRTGMAGHSEPPGWPKPLPGPLTQGRKGLLPSQSFHSPSWTEAVAPGRRPCVCRAHRARTLCPSAFQLPPARQEAQGVVHPLWVPGRETGSQAPLSGSAAQEHGWGPGSEQLSDTAMTVCRPRAPLSCPAQDTSQLSLSTRGPGRLCPGTGCRSAARHCG